MLKVITTACLLMSLLLAILWPRMLNSRPPKGAPRTDIRRFAKQFLIYNTVVIVSLGGASIGAILIMRQAREEYRKLAKDNMKLMVEGTLHDHRRLEREEDARE